MACFTPIQISISISILSVDTNNQTMKNNQKNKLYTMKSSPDPDFHQELESRPKIKLKEKVKQIRKYVLIRIQSHQEMTIIRRKKIRTNRKAKFSSSKLNLFGRRIGYLLIFTEYTGSGEVKFQILTSCNLNLGEIEKP